MNINTLPIELQSSFFARVISTDEPIVGLTDCVIYLRAEKGSEWDKAIEPARADLMPYIPEDMPYFSGDIQLLPDHNAIARVMQPEDDVIMPVIMLGSEQQHYIVGSIEEVDQLSTAASLLCLDCKSLFDSTVPQALSMIDNEKMDYIVESAFLPQPNPKDNFISGLKSAFDDFVSFGFLNSSVNCCISFRGSLPQRPKKSTAEDAIEKNEQKIIKLKSARKKMRSNDDQTKKEGLEELDAVLMAMTPIERKILFNELIKRTQPSVLDQILENDLDCERLGRITDYKMELVKYQRGDKKKYNLKQACNYLLFLVTDTDDRKLMHVGKRANVLYVLSLIDRKVNNEHRVVNINDNKEAYISVYNILYGGNRDEDEDEAKKSYDSLIIRVVGNDERLRKGRLAESYTKINGKLKELFKELTETESPFCIGADTPLMLAPEKIELPKCLMNIEIR